MSRYIPDERCNVCKGYGFFRVTMSKTMRLGSSTNSPKAPDV
jgi:hypothetical protein